MDDFGDLVFDASGALVDVTERGPQPGPPPDLTWSRFELVALTKETLFGSLVTLSDHRGMEHNLVVVSDIFSDDGGTWVRVVPYSTFAAWGQAAPETRPATPRPARAVLLRLLWTMHAVAPDSGSGMGSGTQGGSSSATRPLPPL